MMQPQRISTTPWGWTLSGALFGLGLGILLFAPAHWLAATVARASGSQVQLVMPQGTIWNGSAHLVLGAGSGSRAHTTLPGRVQWQLHPGANGLQLALSASCCLKQAWVWTLTPSLTGLMLRFSDQAAAQPSLWPSALLAGLGTPWNTLQLQGVLALSNSQLALLWHSGRWQLAGQAQLDAVGLSTSLSTLKPVGSYRLTLSGGPSPTLTLSTLGGSLHLSGSGQWVGDRLRFNGEASAEPERADALANLLNIIGRRDGARSIIKVG
jgi:general secretion pathway protein N